MIFVGEADREKHLAESATEGQGEKHCSQRQLVHDDCEDEWRHESRKALNRKVHVELGIGDTHVLLDLSLKRGWPVPHELTIRMR